MERSKAGKKESENRALYQQLLNLEKDWDSFKRSNKPLHFPQISSKSDASSTTRTLDFLKLLENSPRSLMSSLQNSKSPLEEEEGVNWKVKKNDLAVEEIIRDRRTALASGKLKGRRLFSESDERSCITTSQEVISEDEICSGCLVLLEQIDGNKNVGNGSSISCSSTSPLSTEKASKDVEIRMIEGNHRAPVNLLERKSWRYGTCVWLLVMALLAITISAFTQGNFFIAGNQVVEVVPLPT